ncbi:hypothetical protein GCM10009867_34300 [Pedococcus aerophilus]|uniref:DUF4265 domain-containing protein n=1 Tax=Pedococcus aerophilus TaxID=436356 RepID=A0ABN3UVS1_9MICO
MTGPVAEDHSGRPVHVFVALEEDEDGYPPYEAEELDAVMRPDGACTIVGTPVFTSGLAVEDIVSVVEVEDGQWWVTDVLLESGHGVVRVVPLGETSFDVVVEALARLGCRAHETSFGLVAADVPPEVDAPSLLALLAAGREDGRWDFDLGVEPG